MEVNEKPWRDKSSSQRQKLKEEVETAIRDGNVLLLGIMEYGDPSARLLQCSAFIVTYLRECDDYFSGRSRGNMLPQTLENFEYLIEKLVELHTSIVPTMNDPQREEYSDD